MYPTPVYRLLKDIPGLKAGAVFNYDADSSSFVHTDKDDDEMAHYYDRATILDTDFFELVEPAASIAAVTQGENSEHPGLYSVVISNLSVESKHRVMHGLTGFLKGRLYSMSMIESAMGTAGLNAYRRTLFLNELTK